MQPLAMHLAPWLERLGQCHTADDVSEVVRMYLRDCSAGQLRHVARLVPAEIRRADDLSAVAMTLMRRVYEGAAPEAGLQEMAEFFAAASRRAAEVLAPPRELLRRPFS